MLGNGELGPQPSVLTAAEQCCDTAIVRTCVWKNWIQAACPDAAALPGTRPGA
jgi:hypothetical protein